LRARRLPHLEKEEREELARRKDISFAEENGLGWERWWVEGQLSLQGRR